MRQSIRRFAERRGLPARLIPTLVEWAFFKLLRQPPEQDTDTWPKLQVLAMDARVSGPDVVKLRGLHKECVALTNKQGT